MLFGREKKKTPQEKLRMKQSETASSRSRLIQKEKEDECGHTMVYTHKLKFPDGEELTLLNASIFDFGTVINPDYAIKPGAKGGLCMNGDDGKKYWYDLGDDGWSTGS